MIQPIFYFLTLLSRLAFHTTYSGTKEALIIWGPHTHIMLFVYRQEWLFKWSLYAACWTYHFPLSSLEIYRTNDHWSNELWLGSRGKSWFYCKYCSTVSVLHSRPSICIIMFCFPWQGTPQTRNLNDLIVSTVLSKCFVVVSRIT